MINGIDLSKLTDLVKSIAQAFVQPLGPVPGAAIEFANAFGLCAALGLAGWLVAGAPMSGNDSNRTVVVMIRAAGDSAFGGTTYSEIAGVQVLNDSRESVLTTLDPTSSEPRQLVTAASTTVREGLAVLRSNDQGLTITTQPGSTDVEVHRTLPGGQTIDRSMQVSAGLPNLP